MAKRPVHWSEGMFLKPHHFQAADRHARDRLRESEDWLHPHDWGLRSVQFDEAEVANGKLILRSCQARFKDGTTLNVPDEATVAPVGLQEALRTSAETMVYLAIPTWSRSRPIIQDRPSGDPARFGVRTIEEADENTGVGEEPVEYRDIQARLLLADPDVPGFESLPLARIVRSAGADAKPEVDPAYVPPILGLDAWGPLLEKVRSLHAHINAWITQEADLLVGRKLSFDSQVLGDADRVLKLSALNASSTALQSILPTRGLHPIEMYRELCRAVGQLAIFGERRRPIEVPGYDHDRIGPIYAEVMAEIRRLIGGAPRVAFEKVYFELQGRNFAAALRPDWMVETSKLYVGVETTELTDGECDALMKQTNFKLGGVDRVGEIFRAGKKGLAMKPLNRIPPALPAGVVYFEIERDPAYWPDVVRTGSLGLRFTQDWARFLTPRMLALTIQETNRTVNLQFAVFAVKAAEPGGAWPK